MKSDLEISVHTLPVARVLERFTAWLQEYGETSWDHQSYFAGPVGRLAKSLYYRTPGLGIVAVAPMIFSEAFIPSARRLFHKRTRFPIADAHYAMGFAYLYETWSRTEHLSRASHFLDELIRARAPGFKDYCWGYPFDWVTRNGVITSGTPLITSTPYMYEAFLQLNKIDPKPERQRVLESIARHVRNEIRDFRTSNRGSSCSYSPFDEGGVLNAAAYRAFLLTSASRELGIEEYLYIAERNLYFVLEAQNPDGSWYYAVDGVRDFVDHFHTCFVLKALAKIHSITGNIDCLSAIRRGADYYRKHLFSSDGLPKPFSRAPRMTVYSRELYDCAECINLCVLLKDRVPEMGSVLNTVVGGILRDWITPNGSFRTRRLHLGWDDVPMHRWGQSQMFRSLAYYLWDSKHQN
ncbi:MAG TPA: hypothetical protein VGG34_12855 [Opitutaceae bacterium]|jgi:hypothetical protein